MLIEPKCQLNYKMRKRLFGVKNRYKLNPRSLVDILQKTRYKFYTPLVRRKTCSMLNTFFPFRNINKVLRNYYARLVTRGAHF